MVAEDQSCLPGLLQSLDARLIAFAADDEGAPKGREAEQDDVSGGESRAEGRGETDGAHRDGDGARDAEEDGDPGQQAPG